jgi:hypothetical protein
MKTKAISKTTRFFVAAITAIGMLAVSRVQAIGPRDAVKEAYAALSVANHDYEGHRVEAMREVQAAGRIMGVDLRGQARGTETDRQSADHMRYARSMLQQARDQGDYLNNKRDRDRVQQHINEAIREINAALKNPAGTELDRPRRY